MAWEVGQALFLAAVLLGQARLAWEGVQARTLREGRALLVLVLLAAMWARVWSESAGEAALGGQALFLLALLL